MWCFWGIAEFISTPLMVYVRMMTENIGEGQEPVPFPEMYDRRELNALYREIPLKDNTSRLLRKYFNAMANLYGVI